MHPPTPAQPGMPTEPLPIAQVNTGMTVVDAAGDEVGTVTAVEMPGAGGPGRDDLAATGCVRVEGTGPLGKDLLVGGDQIAGVTTTENGVVTLAVRRDALTEDG
jgi:hypothetical protein